MESWEFYDRMDSLDELGRLKEVRPGLPSIRFFIGEKRLPLGRLKKTGRSFIY
jgi:hypothetical protein